MPRISHWGKTEGPRAGAGFLGRGQQSCPHQLGGLGSAVSSPRGVRGGALTAQRVSTIFSTHDGLLPWPSLAYAPGRCEESVMFLCCVLLLVYNATVEYLHEGLLAVARGLSEVK